ncbi:MAG: T9SS type A sorting domain-containing protein [Muribaculaceae bacterium]|nr:T9SS type A sorting domain-containing protein [Muribaculaceae bacterium]
MRKILTILLLALSATAFGQLPRNQQPPARTVSELAPEEVTVSVEDGYILISLPRQAQVKIFTILGQPVMTTNLGAGTSRLRLPARGIYILKIGTITRRITL